MSIWSPCGHHPLSCSPLYDPYVVIILCLYDHHVVIIVCHVLICTLTMWLLSCVMCPSIWLSCGFHPVSSTHPWSPCGHVIILCHVLICMITMWLSSCVMFTSVITMWSSSCVMYMSIWSPCGHHPVSCTPLYDHHVVIILCHVHLYMITMWSASCVMYSYVRSPSGYHLVSYSPLYDHHVVIMLCRVHLICIPCGHNPVSTHLYDHHVVIILCHVHVYMYHSAWEVQRHRECYKSNVACCADHSQCNNALWSVHYNVILHWLQFCTSASG